MIFWSLDRSKNYILLLSFFTSALLAGQSYDTIQPCLKIPMLFQKADSVYEIGSQLELNLSLLTKASMLSDSCQDAESEVLALAKMSFLYKEQLDLYNYERMVDTAISVAVSKLDSFHYLFPYLYSESADILKGNREYRKAIQSSINGLNHSREKNTDLDVYLNNLIAKCHMSLDNYSKAEDFLYQAESICRFNEIINDYVYMTYQLIAHVHMYQNSYKEAHKYFIKAEKELFDMNTVGEGDLVHLWIAMAKFYVKNENHILGQHYLDKVVNSEYDLDSIMIGEYKRALAIIYNSKKEESTSHEILQLLKESNQIYSSTVNTDVSFDVKHSQNYELMGDIYLKSINLDSAYLAYGQAIQKLGFQDDLDTPELVTNKTYVIGILKKMREIEIRRKAYAKVKGLEDILIKLIRRLSTETSTNSVKKFWASENQTLFEEIIDYNYQNERYDRVFTLIEENKSNILLKDINQDMAFGYADIPGEKLSQIHEKEAEVANYKIRRSKMDLLDSVDARAYNKVISAMNASQISLDDLYRNLEASYPEYYKMKYEGREVTITDLQKQLDNKTVLFEYFIGLESGYVAIISNNKYEVLELADLDSIKDNSLKYYQTISDNNASEVNISSEYLFGALGFNFLEQHSSEVNNLIVIADDFLNNIPFELLSDEAGEPLVDNYGIQYQYSTRLWEILKNRKEEQKSYDFVGYAFSNSSGTVSEQRSCITVDPSNLKCASREIDNVINLLGDVNSEVSGGAIKELLPLAADAKILHLATHACLDENDSDLSRVYFDDGILTDQDLKVKDLSADLVVLSACETGYGEIIKGEGSMSLSKSFFHAGASSTLVSLWPVDDCTTADLMEYFYKNLKEGQTKDAALRNAKLSYQKYANPEKTHPYYWAGFVIIGDCAPVWESGNYFYWLLVGLAILLAMLFYLSKRSRA